MTELLLKDAFESAKKKADKDVRRISLIFAGSMETALRLDPFSEEGKQFRKEAAAVIADHADERGLFGDPFRDERHHAYIYTKRWLPEQYHEPVGVSAGTPADYDEAWKKKYLGGS
jgi:hypothetical protein